MKKILILSLTLILTTLFIGCGGGGGSSFGDTNLETAVVTCTANDTASNTAWTIVTSGQTVTVTANTELLWKQTSIKEVCVKVTAPTGSAKVN